MERFGGTRLRQVQGAAATYFTDHGDWDQALLYLDQLLDGGIEEAHQRLRVRGHYAFIAISQGSRTLAERQIATVGDLDPRDRATHPEAGRLIQAEALIAEADGRNDDAVQLLSARLGLPVDRPDRFEELVHLARVALSAGDRVTAGAAAAVACAAAGAGTAEEAGAVWAAGCAAMLADDPRPLLAAARHLAAQARRPAQAAMLEEAAVRLASLRRLQARLRPHGLRLGPRSPHRRARTGWDSLTPAELTVVAEIAAGRSNTEIANRLFLSRRTVETHVSHILAKLQVGTRLEIFRFAAEHVR